MRSKNETILAIFAIQLLLASSRCITEAFTTAPRSLVMLTPPRLKKIQQNNIIISSSFPRLELARDAQTITSTTTSTSRYNNNSPHEESSVLNPPTVDNSTEPSIPLPSPPTSSSSSSSSSLQAESSSENNSNNNSDESNDNQNPIQTTTTTTTTSPRSKNPPFRTTRTKRKMELAWCNHDHCENVIREKVVGEHNHMELTGPATGQVAYSWEQYSMESVVEGDIELGKCKLHGTNTSSGNDRDVSGSGSSNGSSNGVTSPPAVLILVKRDDEELTKVAMQAIEELVGYGVQVLVDETLAGELSHYDTIMDMESSDTMIRLFEPRPVPGFGTGDQLFQSSLENGVGGSVIAGDTPAGPDGEVSGEECDDEEDIIVETPPLCPADLSDADLIVTLGGDGLLMYAAHVFSGPVPPILPVAGGSMGFLTPFQREEMVEAILISLGLRQVNGEVEAVEKVDESTTVANNGQKAETSIAKNNPSSSSSMKTPAVMYKNNEQTPTLAFGKNNKICISMRMRLDCRIFNADGSLKSRYNVLNEVVIDRGSSPYLASLECFCDDVHLTTVQADGIIFSTPTGSTAYSMAAGGSVVHPAVPAILVTPICPHVLSFRSMIFPDHVVLRCYVPDDARSTACVYFDGKHRTELHRGDSVQIEMSAHPVPTINRADHSSDWLSSLKRNFNFNTRVRQNPLR